MRFSLMCACLVLMLVAADFFSPSRYSQVTQSRPRLSSPNISSAKIGLGTVLVVDQRLNLLRHQRFALCDKMQRIVFRRPHSNTSMYFVGDSTALQTFRATVATATRCMSMFARRRRDDMWLAAAERLIVKNRELLHLITKRVTQTSPLIKIVGWDDPKTASTLTFYFVRALYAVTAGQAVAKLSRDLCPSHDVLISVHVGTWDLLRPEYRTNGYALDQNFSANMTAWRDIVRSSDVLYRTEFVAPVEEAAERCRGAVIVSAVARPNCSAKKFSRVAEAPLFGDGAAAAADPYRYVQRGACRRLVVSGTWKSMHSATLSSFSQATVRDADALVWQQHVCSMSDGAHIDAEVDELGEVADAKDFESRTCRLFSQQSLWNLIVLT